MNRQLFPTEEFVLTLQGFTAGPHDQRMRVSNLEPKTIRYRQELSELTDGPPYGETDIVESYALNFGPRAMYFA